MVQKVTSQAEARELIEKQEALRKRAAKQAAKTLVNPVEIPTVECVVLPQGDGKISMGEHVPGLGTAHYEEGETFTIQLPIAVALYDRGFVNFEGAREASQKARAEREDAEMRALAADIRLRKMIDAD